MTYFSKWALSKKCPFSKWLILKWLIFRSDRFRGYLFFLVTIFSKWSLIKNARFRSDWFRNDSFFEVNYLRLSILRLHFSWGEKFSEVSSFKNCLFLEWLILEWVICRSVPFKMMFFWMWQFFEGSLLSKLLSELLILKSSSVDSFLSIEMI